jgi:hypothetical protein
MRRVWRGTFVFTVAAFWITVAPAQTPGQQTPCGIALASDLSLKTQGLVLTQSGLVYDENQGLCWLANANLAGDPLARLLLSPLLTPNNPDPEGDGPNPPIIHPDGTMNFETALNWVNAMKAFNGGRGWLNHTNWQLPDSTDIDSNCSSHNSGNFGALCTASAMANLYNVGLARTYPNSVVPHLFDIAWPFLNLQPGLYWSSKSAGDAGYASFSFNTGDQGANTTNYNFLHVLPMTADVLGPIPSGLSVVRPYLSGPGAGKAVYDSNTKLSWTLDANLAASNRFGFNGEVTLTTNLSDPDVNHSQFPMTIPLIDADGAMHFSAICGPATSSDDCPSPAAGWIVSMNSQTYAGSVNWSVPGVKDLNNLYADLLITAGDPRLQWPLFVGPFYQLQPGFYWSCVRDDTTANNQAPCDYSIRAASAGTPMEYSFDFDDGFQGTDDSTKHFYLMVYFPAPAKP